MDNFFVIGQIVNTQGIKGEMRVIPHTDDKTRFELIKNVYVDRKGNIECFEIENIRYHKQFVLMKLKDIDDINTAEKYKTAKLKIPREMALKCEENEYYISDLYDMNVFTDDGEKLGVITDIIFTGANDVYCVKNEDSEILIPAIKKCILNVDIKNNTMTVKLMEGLR